MHRQLSPKEAYVMLIFGLKQYHFVGLEEYFLNFKSNKTELLRRYVRVNETWIHYFTTELKKVAI